MIASSEEMRRMDARMVSERHIGMEQLVKQAGDALYDVLMRTYGANKCYAIFCGSGNNGADGMALALRMQSEGVTFVLCAPLAPLSDCARVYADRLTQAKVLIRQSLDAREIERCDVLVDALFGTGINRPIEGVCADLIDLMNAGGKPIVAVDIPSGLDGDGALAMGKVVRASHTVSFACVKWGMLAYARRCCCGRIECVDIGIPKALIQGRDQTLLLETKTVQAMLPKRYAQSHKGSYGRVLVIGGSTHMSGALVLCVRAVLRSGVGLVTCALPNGIHTIVASQIQEAMYRPLPQDHGQICARAFAENIRLEEYDLIVVGNGMGKGENTRSIVAQVLASEVPCILDGDALYEAGTHDLLPQSRLHDVILTPHPKELSILCKEPLSSLREHPWQSVQKLSERYPYVTIAAKDDVTWVLGKGQRALNIGGSDGLAKGGSGDVLCGMIAGLYAQWRDAFAAVCAAVFTHAYSAQRLAQRMDTMSMLPSDLIAELPNAYAQIRRGE